MSTPLGQLYAELKHSIKMHMMVADGPSPQLCVFLTKPIDWLEDPDDERKIKEVASLAYAIVEAIALLVHKAIDVRHQQLTHANKPFPATLRRKGDQLLVVVGKTRGLSDKIVAKHAVMTEVASAIKAYAEFNKTKCPTLQDITGKPYAS